MERFEIVRISLMDPDFLMDEEILAETPEKALEVAGYRVDGENPFRGEGVAFSGAEPRNEYGNPLYPHFRAQPVGGGDWYLNKPDGE
jgi:hypothetical protein